MKFSPMLATDATDHLDNIKYPKYASYKLDGIRVLFHPELGIVSRSLKPIQNKQLREKFQHILDKAKYLNRVFDGEFYHHNLTFQEITALVMTKDFMDPKTIKKLEKEKFKLCKYYGVRAGDTIDTYEHWFENPLEFHCFETHHLEMDHEMFSTKITIIHSVRDDHTFPVHQEVVYSKEDVMALFSRALDEGYEGLILREPHSPYKCGRSTLKEEYMLKVKPFETFDTKIIDVEQATEVDPEVEKKINELGRSVTSRKKDDRVLIEKAAAFWVKYGEHKLKVSLAMTDEEKEEVWTNRSDYIGRMIEYKGMKIGSKDVPRHPVFVRFRDDRQ